jgi:hypothetical protein
MDVGRIVNAVSLACRAPSVHNSQPWRWVINDGSGEITVHLFSDRRRAVPATDPSGRQAILSCGVALDHFRVAMAAARWRARITRFPDPRAPDHLATVEFDRLDDTTAVHRRRADAILRRRTDRLPLDCPAYWQAFEPVLHSTVNQDREDPVTLDVLSDDQRPQLVQASRLAADLRREDESYQAELQWWTSPFALAQGVPPAALASDTERIRVDVGRDFPVRGHQDRRAEMTEDRSKILVLSTPADTRDNMLRCGEVLSTVLLECTMAGMATCPLTHLIETDESRGIVRRLIGEPQAEPQVLVRVGITPPFDNPSAPSPRRPIDDVLELR